MRFSASRMRVWEECALKAFYRYDQQLPTRQNAKASFGTVIHHAIQLYNETDNYELALADFKSNWLNPGQLGVEPDYWPKMTSYNSLKNRGYQILKSLHDKQRFTHRTVVGTEIGFVVPMGEHELHGFIDCLEIQHSGTGTELLKIVDYKSNSREPFKSALALDIQFTAYHFAVSQREFWVGNEEFPGVENGEWLWDTVGSMMTKRCIWYHLWNNKEIDAGPRGKTDYERMYRLMCEIDASDKAGIHVPHIGEACEWCDFTESCTMEIPVAIQAATDKTDSSRWV